MDFTVIVINILMSVIHPKVAPLSVIIPIVMSLSFSVIIPSVMILRAAILSVTLNVANLSVDILSNVILTFPTLSAITLGI